jgi:hypothetical protein
MGSIFLGIFFSVVFVLGKSRAKRYLGWSVGLISGLEDSLFGCEGRRLYDVHDLDVGRLVILNIVRRRREERDAM